MMLKAVDDKTADPTALIALLTILELTKRQRGTKLGLDGVAWRL